MWRTKYELGPLQIECKKAEEYNLAKKAEYSVYLDFEKLNRPFNYSVEQCLAGFKEVIERYLELEKARRSIQKEPFAHLKTDLTIGALADFLDKLEAYRNGSLHANYLNDVKYLRMEITWRNDHA